MTINIAFLLNKCMNPQLMFLKFNCYTKHTYEVSEKIYDNVLRCQALRLLLFNFYAHLS